MFACPCGYIFIRNFNSGCTLLADYRNDREHDRPFYQAAGYSGHSSTEFDQYPDYRCIHVHYTDVPHQRDDTFSHF